MVWKNWNLDCMMQLANFNIGRQTTLDIYKKLGLNPGEFTVKGCSNFNSKGLFQAALTAPRNRKREGK